MNNPLDPDSSALSVSDDQGAALDYDLASQALDRVAEIEGIMASLSAFRARLITNAYDAALMEERTRPAAQSLHARAEMARQTVVSELAALVRVTPAAAAHLVAESRALTSTLPATLDALGRGEISYRHAQVVIDHAALLPDDGVALFEHAILPGARRLNIARFRDRARRARELTHPESVAARRVGQFDRRSVSVDPASDGMAWLTAYLPAELAIAIDDRLDQLAASLRDPHDLRTFTQMRADAFCDLVLRGEVDGVRRGIRANALVTVPVLTLLGHDDEPASLEGYGPIPADVARVLAGDATGFTRLLTHPETGVVLSVGRDRYTVPAGLRLWLRARDETCRMVGCGRRASVSDVDHGHAWVDGGTTSGDNLAHLCRGDHTRKHTLGWSMKHLPGGVIRWTSPMGRRYVTEPSSVMRT